MTIFFLILFSLFDFSLPSSRHAVDDTSMVLHVVFPRKTSQTHITLESFADHQVTLHMTSQVRSTGEGQIAVTTLGTTQPVPRDGFFFPPLQPTGKSPFCRSYKNEKSIKLTILHIFLHLIHYRVQQYLRVRRLGGRFQES